MRHRAWVQTSRHQAGNVGHIHHQLGANLLGNIRQGGKINNPRISRSAGHKQLGLLLPGNLAHMVVINNLSFRLHTVSCKVVGFAGVIHRAAVG